LCGQHNNLDRLQQIEEQLVSLSQSTHQQTPLSNNPPSFATQDASGNDRNSLQREHAKRTEQLRSSQQIVCQVSSILVKTAEALQARSQAAGGACLASFLPFAVQLHSFLCPLELFNAGEQKSIKEGERLHSFYARFLIEKQQASLAPFYISKLFEGNNTTTTQRNVFTLLHILRQHFHCSENLISTFALLLESVREVEREHFLEVCPAPFGVWRFSCFKGVQTFVLSHQIARRMFPAYSVNITDSMLTSLMSKSSTDCEDDTELSSFVVPANVPSSRFFSKLLVRFSKIFA